jgi:CubicO group peptidase (beta-lactamase class C family)
VNVEVTPRKAGFSRRRLERITAHLERNYVAPGKIPGCQVAVARRGRLAYFRSLGSMDLERGRTMADDTIFRIYSMTKPVTSVALMQLFERGLFQLDDPVLRFIPAWRNQQIYASGEGESMVTHPPERPMTIRHLLTHTAGLSYGATGHPVDQRYRALGVRRGPGETLAGFVDKLAGVPLHFAPGRRWMYSYATDVCGHLVEVLSGMPLDRYFSECIFEPLNMRDTGFRVSPAELGRFAANYERTADKSLRRVDDPENSPYGEEPTFLSGGGGLVGTTGDYLRFCEMLRRGGELDGARIVGRRTLELMTRNHLPGGADLSSLAMGAFSETAYEGIGFGLGFAMSLSSVTSGVLGEGDFYWGGAASTIFWVDPAERLSVVFMTQLMPSATFNFRGQLKNIIYSSIED